MESYLNRSIKGIISKNPEVAKILNSYNLGCVPCSGSCHMRHVLENQYLSEKQEQEMLCRIEQVIYADKDIKDPALKKTKNKVNLP